MKQSELDALERQRQALELRKAGVPYATIAERLGYASTGGAHKAVASALKKTLAEPADDLRRLEVERLDALLSALWRQAKEGNQGAVDRCIRIMERRAKLLGLDAPTKQDITSGGEKLKAYIGWTPEQWAAEEKADDEKE